MVEGLLSDEDEKVVLDLIFILATWHAYAKLRLHTDNTLASFDGLTRPLGLALRHFGGKFSEQFDTRELPKEAEARKRREATSKNQGKPSTKRKTASIQARFNLSTYKLHALGDYAETIRQRGTTDSYNTQTVRNSILALSQCSLTSYLQGECEHRRVKRFYARTNHRFIAKSISGQEARQRLVRGLARTKNALPTDEMLPDISPNSSYVISKPWKESRVARSWMIEQEADPLFKVSGFVSSIQNPLTTLSGLRLEPQEIRPITAAHSRWGTYGGRHSQHRY